MPPPQKDPDTLRDVSEFDYTPSAPMQKLPNPAQNPSKEATKMARENSKMKQPAPENLKKPQNDLPSNPKPEEVLKARITDGSSKRAEKRLPPVSPDVPQNDRCNDPVAETPPTPRIVDGSSKRARKVPEMQKPAEEVPKNVGKHRSRREVELAEAQKPSLPRISTQTAVTPTSSQLKPVKVAESLPSDTSEELIVSFHANLNETRFQKQRCTRLIAENKPKSGILGQKMRKAAVAEDVRGQRVSRVKFRR